MIASCVFLHSCAWNAALGLLCFRHFAVMTERKKTMTGKLVLSQQDIEQHAPSVLCLFPDQNAQQITARLHFQIWILSLAPKWGFIFLIYRCLWAFIRECESRSWLYRWTTDCTALQILTLYEFLSAEDVQAVSILCQHISDDSLSWAASSRRCVTMQTSEAIQHSPTADCCGPNQTWLVMLLQRWLRFTAVLTARLRQNPSYWGKTRKLRGTGITSEPAQPQSSAAPLTAILGLMTGCVTLWHRCTWAAGLNNCWTGVKACRFRVHNEALSLHCKNTFNAEKKWAQTNSPQFDQPFPNSPLL